MTPQLGFGPASGPMHFPTAPVGIITSAPPTRPESRDEVQGSRLSNFLSDDISAEGRDSDPTRSGRSFAPALTTYVDSAQRPHDESAPPPPQEKAASTDIPAPMRGGNQIVVASPVESAIRSVLDRQSPVITGEAIGSPIPSRQSLDAVAQYTNVQDVLTRLST
ncbi:MAG: hypothetical protein MJH10_05010 [Epibacterium sp.]|nr:hypothetical protein [Epibacterium sp.]NQX72912.1 hypothetical protein [Epibacterium sp.]